MHGLATRCKSRSLSQSAPAWGELLSRRASVGGDNPGASAPRCRATRDSGSGASGHRHYRRIRRPIERVAGWCRNRGSHKTHLLVTTSGAPQWAVWPDPGDRFSYADYRAAFALINAAPDELARHYAEPPRHMSTEVPALLSLVSPDLAERVDAFRTKIWRERTAMGASPEVVETAQIRWSEIREKLAGAVISREGE